MTDAKQVTKALVDQLYPALVGAGFERDGDRKLRRYLANRIEIVDLHSLGRVQAERLGEGTTPASFGCQLAVYFPAVPQTIYNVATEGSRLAPDVGAGHFQVAVTRRVRQFLPNFGKEYTRTDLWLIAQPQDIETALADLCAQWPRAVKWFAQFDRLDQVVAKLHSPYEWRMTPDKWLLIGCLALEAGKPELVEPALLKVLSDGVYNHLRAKLHDKIDLARERLDKRIKT
jgi:hypothetical protein